MTWVNMFIINSVYFVFIQVQNYYGKKYKVAATDSSSSSGSETEEEDKRICVKKLQKPVPTQNYRPTTIGNLLKETLDELFLQNKISDNICRKTWAQFDRSVLNAFRKIPRIHLAFRAKKIHSYVKVEDLLFALDHVEFRERNMLGNVARVN